MLGWLRAEAVTPSPSEADSDYVDFLVSLDTAQALLDGASSSRRALDGDHCLAVMSRDVVRDVGRESLLTGEGLRLWSGAV